MNSDQLYFFRDELEKLGRSGTGTEGGEATAFRKFKITQGWNVSSSPSGKKLKLLESHDSKSNTMSYSLHDAERYEKEGARTSRVAYMAISSPVGKSIKDARVVEIKGMYVDPDHRRKNLGKTLVAATRQLRPSAHFLAKPDPFKDRSVSRDDLEKVYSSYGFRKVGLAPGYMVALAGQD